jgi:hypothetical protein
MLLDALIHKVAGNSPGKALLGLEVGTSTAQPLSFGEYLRRNLSLWLRGLGLGIPVVSLCTLVQQYSRLGEGLQTSYDDRLGARVRQAPTGWLRRLVFGVSFCAMLVGLTVLNQSSEEATRAQARRAASADFSWENPITQRSVPVAAQWSYEPVNNNQGNAVYMFREAAAQRAIVVFGYEAQAGLGLADYAKLFQKANAGTMQFTDGGLFREREGQTVWLNSGSIAGPPTMRFSVEVRQAGAGFWRVVSIQSLPYIYSDTMVSLLSDALWSTIKAGGNIERSGATRPMVATPLPGLRAYDEPSGFLPGAMLIALSDSPAKVDDFRSIPVTGSGGRPQVWQ